MQEQDLMETKIVVSLSREDLQQLPQKYDPLKYQQQLQQQQQKQNQQQSFISTSSSNTSQESVIYGYAPKQSAINQTENGRIQPYIIDSDQQKFILKEKRDYI